MKSITAKMIIISILVMIVASIVPNILWSILSGSFDRPNSIEEVTPIMMIVVGASTAATTIIIYGVVVNKLLLKRIKTLTNATQDVMNGNFDTTITEKGKDEISQLIHNFNQMTEELQNNEYINKEFVRNFSHELKTPLAAIKGYAELLNSENIDETEKNEYINVIVDESTRLSHLSKNMLLISQVDSRMIIPTVDKYNITEQIRNIIQFYQIGWEKRELSFDLDFKEVQVTSNKEFTYQIFSNLLSNSIKFSPNKGLIEMSLTEDKSMVFFTISNQGSLTEEQCEQVFDLFYIKDKSRSSKSSGVGLSLTKKIVSKLDGHIEVESQNNKVTFKLTLKKQI